jgi:hypothetical protein
MTLTSEGHTQNGSIRGDFALNHFNECYQRSFGYGLTNRERVPGDDRTVQLGDVVNAKVTEDILCGRWGWTVITTS